MMGYVSLTIAALGISWLLYQLLLKGEKNFVFNRFYLLGTLALCLIAPALQLDPGENFPVIPSVDYNLAKETTGVTDDNPEESTVRTIEKELFSFKDFLILCYFIVGGFLLIRFGKNLLQIFSNISSAEIKHVSDLKLVPVNSRGNPYSFFNYIFLHPADLDRGSFTEAVIEHEGVHSRQLHSADILAVELLCCIFWFNPFLWHYKKAILENHEFLADAGVVTKGMDAYLYSKELIAAGIKTFNGPISGFSFVQTKKRLHMLHMKKSSGFATSIKIATVVGLFAAVITVSSFTGHVPSAPYIVVVDAGHGGKDPGNKNEKDVNLAIARQLASLSSTEIKFILTRDGDEFLDFDARKKFIRDQNADLLLSLHCNASPAPSRSGVEAFHLREGEFKQESYEISQILVEEQLQGITNKGEIKMANFMILRDLTHPAVLFELGYLSNPEDAARLEDAGHQQLVARNIYNALLKVKKAR